MNRRGRGILLLGFLVTIVVPSTVAFYTDWLWFGETGYRDVFVRTWLYRVTLGAVVTAVAFGAILLNVRVAMRALVARRLVFMTREGPMRIDVDRQRAQPLAAMVAAVVALLFGLWTSSRWLDWLLFRHAQPFGEVDPVLGRDLGFYMLQLPFLEALQQFLLVLAAVSLAATAATYVLAGALRFDADRGSSITGNAKHHLAGLVCVVMLTLAFKADLDIPGLLTSPDGIVYGVTNVDAAVWIPALKVLIVVALVGAILAATQTVVASWWPAATAVVLYLVVPTGGFLAASLMQRFVIAPNELARETQFIGHNIEATRKAFNLDRVEQRELSGDSQLTRGDIEANRTTLGNVRLWDHEPLLQTFAQIQEIRTYYDFVSVHNDRYLIDGEYRQIMLSARELNSESLPNRNWINERLTFTHGYGVTLGPVNQVTPEGLPVLFIKDLPPKSSVNLTIDEPSIYYGERSSDYVFVKTRAREFHYPKGDDNVYTSYDGTGGVPVSNFFRRLLFSVRFGSFKVLFSDDITNESRVMFHRQLSQRVQRIAPFLTYDPSPYLVISDGRLLWVQDGYTTSRRYPYSTPSATGVNYIRNSVKATVDAYHGTVVFYTIDDADPIVATYRRIFPELFKPLSEMREDMRNRLRYPEGIFDIQAEMYASYHMTSPSVFYNKEDLWEIPTMQGRTQPQQMRPYYTIMRLPGEEAPEFIQMLPFTPARKDNLASWMVARSDGAHYGRMMVFQFPKQKVVFGPRQIVARISQDETIAPQVTLWNQQGSEVLQGTLLVIPIEESLLYVRPLYLRSAGGRIPELKRVIVAHQNQIVMEDTLDKALDRLFPVGTDRPDTPTRSRPGDIENGDGLVSEALEHYLRAVKAQREGNWAKYGSEIQRVGEILKQMNPQSGP
jgi:uncharacterized membrane protein (UPF0182 family)